MPDGPGFWAARFAATEAGARDAAKAVAVQLACRGIAAERRGDMEIAAAEAVNNVVEHAYGLCAAGTMHVSLEQCGRNLCLVLRDTGRPLPGGRMPAGRAADLSGPVTRLPEGGFGWFLIRTLADSVDYRQARGENRLTLRFADVFP